MTNLFNPRAAIALWILRSAQNDSIGFENGVYISALALDVDVFLIALQDVGLGDYAFE
jgi:hypothetical protein